MDNLQNQCPYRLYISEKGNSGKVKGEVTIYGLGLSDFTALRLFRNGYHSKNYPIFKCAHIDNFCKILYVTSMELKMDKSSGRTCVLLESQSLKLMICTILWTFKLLQMCLSKIRCQLVTEKVNMTSFFLSFCFFSFPHLVIGTNGSVL